MLGGYLLLYPRARVLTIIFIIFFFTIIELPALVMLGLWFLQQIYFGYADLSDPTGGGGGVAYWAHIGGFVFGLLAIKAVRQAVKDARAEVPRVLMGVRQLILGVVLVFILGLGFLTIEVAVTEGFDVLSALFAARARPVRVWHRRGPAASSGMR